MTFPCLLLNKHYLQPFLRVARVIVEADKPVLRVSIIGFEFKLQLNRQRYGQLYRQF